MDKFTFKESQLEKLLHLSLKTTLLLEVCLIFKSCSNAGAILQAQQQADLHIHYGNSNYVFENIEGRGMLKDLGYRLDTSLTPEIAREYLEYAKKHQSLFREKGLEYKFK